MSSPSRHRRRASGARRRSISPQRAEGRRERSRSRSRSRSCERRRRRRSKTLPDTSDNRDDKGSRRHSRHAGRHREKSRRDSRRDEPDSDGRARRPRDCSPEKPSKAASPVSVPGKTPTTARGKSPSAETQSPRPPSPAAATPARPKTARGSEAEDSAPTPDFRLSGKLAAEANAVNGVELKYSEPAEARRPVGARWRIYVFKDGKDIDMHHVDSASAFLFGRDRKVADIPTDHPSCSSQHAVLQYRQTAESVKPYLIDLASTNGTYLNGQRIPAQRFVELRSEDVVKLGFSTREYVLLRESPS
ncbi:hypothetical protein H4S02_000193 [Coemansia sp. RSA 2611]|nr:hypothetical protein H4S02_000193 [Coemansia sp. RSA 2611]